MLDNNKSHSYLMIHLTLIQLTIQPFRSCNYKVSKQKNKNCNWCMSQPVLSYPSVVYTAAASIPLLCLILHHYAERLPWELQVILHNEKCYVILGYPSCKDGGVLEFDRSFSRYSRSSQWCIQQRSNLFFNLLASCNYETLKKKMKIAILGLVGID